MKRYVLVEIVLFIALLMSSSCNEKIRPESETVRYWNLNKSLKIRVDQRLTQNRRLLITLKDGTNEIPLSYILTHSSTTNFNIKVSYPKLQPLPQSETFLLRIKYQHSLKELSQLTIIPDYHAPEIEIISQSSRIKQGGSAMVIFHAIDENIKHIYIKDNSGKIFHPRTFIEKDYFISLLVWYIPYTRYSATLYAVDEAGNTSQTPIIFKKERTKIPVSILKLNPNFVASKKKELGLKKGTKEDKSGYDQVKKKLAQKSSVNIHYLTSYVSPDIYTDGYFKPFKPLQKYRITSAFGKLRKYQYQGKITKQSYHMGLDIAHIKNTPIYNSNPAQVAFADYNGGYGNTMVLNHGIGLYSLFGHCSELLVAERAMVESGKNVAISGTTGYSTGDHVHFSILIQGVYADPKEWMNKEWVDKNINAVIKKARRAIAIRSYEEITLSQNK